MHGHNAILSCALPIEVQKSNALFSTIYRLRLSNHHFYKKRTKNKLPKELFISILPLPILVKAIANNALGL